MCLKILIALIFGPLAAQVAVTGTGSLTGHASATAVPPANPPVQILSTKVGTISLTGASISWMTNQPQYTPYACTASYGPAISYGTTTAATKYGIVGLIGLKSGVTYHYSIGCSDGTRTVTTADATFTTLSAIPNAPARTMIDNELGVMLLGPPSGGSYAGLGAGTFSNMPVPAFSGMGPQAIKINHTVFYAGGDTDQVTSSWFPYNELLAYDTDETAAGKNSLFVTGTYNNSHYPVYSTISGQNCYTARQWVDVPDPRYVRFFVNEHARKLMLDEVFPTITSSPYYRTSWVGSDEGAFQYSSSAMYPGGCSGSAVNPPTWDTGYAQSDSQLLQAIMSFNRQIHQQPDMHLVVNEGTIVNEHLDNWFNLFGSFDGIDREGGYANGGATPAQFEYGMQHQAMLIASGAMVLERQQSDNSAAQIENGVVRYLLTRGGNSFYSIANGATWVDPSNYQPILDALGFPTALYVEHTVGTNSYNAYYSRAYEGGIVYFNADTTAHTVKLPAGTWYLNNSGSPVTNVTLAPNTNADTAAGVYVTSQQGTFVSMPTYSPSTLGKTITGPVVVRLADTTTGATIHYTTDGSTPTCSSSTYSSPLSLTTTTTVKAIGCASGVISSWVKTATYSIASAQPTVTVANATDSASSFFAGTYLTFQLSNPTASTVAIEYSVSASSGATASPSDGILTIPPFEVARSAYIKVALNSGVSTPQTVRATITGATNAAIGSQATYTYTISPYTFASTTKWLKLAPQANAIVASSSPSSVFANGSTVIYAGYSTVSGNERMLLKYDLSSIPSNATIKQAQIKGYVPFLADSAGTCSMTASVYRMLTPWTQSRATWNNSGGVPSNYAASPTDTENACNPLTQPVTHSQDLYWDVTSDVQNIVNGSSRDYGWVFIGPENQTGNEYWEWYSNNYLDPNNNPVSPIMVSLIVTYTVPQLSSTIH